MDVILLLRGMKLLKYLDNIKKIFAIYPALSLRNTKFIMLVRNLQFSLFLLLFNGYLHAQKPARYWSWGANAGFGWASSTTEKINGDNHYRRIRNSILGSVTSVDGRSYTAVMATTSIGIHGSYLFADRYGPGFTSVFAEVQRNKATYTFQPPFVFGPADEPFSAWVQMDKYVRYGLGLERSWYYGGQPFLNGDAFIYARAAFSQTALHRSFDQKIEERFEDWRFNGTGMTSRLLNIQQQSFMVSAEIGHRSTSASRDRMLDFGLAFHIPFQRTYTEEYEFYQNNVAVGKGRVTYGGAMVVLNCRYSFNFKTKQSIPDTTQEESQPDIVVQTSDSSSTAMDIQSRMTVKEREIIIEVWDRDEVDGDRITLFLNGQPVAVDLTLTKRHKRYKLKLEPGTNHLVMHAENLGTKPPNTAAIEVKSNGKKRNVTLVSDQKQDGTIEIIYNPYD